LEEEIIEKNIKLIVLDSVASVMRKDFDGSNVVLRQNMLSKQASILKYLAETFNIPVIVSNQVTTKYDKEQMLGYIPHFNSTGT
jgi:RAD51-like protein 1